MQSLIVLVGVLAVASAGHLGSYGYGEVRTVVGGERSIIAGPSGTIHADTGSIIKSEGVLAPRVLPAAPLLAAPLLPAARLVNSYATATTHIRPATSFASVRTFAPALSLAAPIATSRIIESAPLLAPRFIDSAPLVAPRLIESAPLVAPRLIESAPLLSRYAATPLLARAGVPLYNNGQYGIRAGLEAPYY